MFGFAKLVLDANSDLQENYAAGVALDAGGVVHAHDRWNIGFRGAASRYLAGETFTRVTVEVDQRIVIDKQNNIRILYEHSRVNDQHNRKASLGWMYYF